MYFATATVALLYLIEYRDRMTADCAGSTQSTCRPRRRACPSFYPGDVIAMRRNCVVSPLLGSMFNWNICDDLRGPAGSLAVYLVIPALTAATTWSSRSLELCTSASAIGVKINRAEQEHGSLLRKRAMAMTRRSRRASGCAFQSPCLRSAV